MQNFWRLIGQLRHYRGLVTANIICNILTAVFTVVSIPLLAPFLRILFEQTKMVTEPAPWSWSLSGIQDFFNYRFSQLIVTEGKETALLYVCITILTVFLLKNLFRYGSLFFMAPVRNGIVRDLRAKLFDQFLYLPLSYFSEAKKGDLLSRMTGDVQEVEWSILNVLEAVFREPLIIVGALGYMLYVSPPLTGFVFGLIVFTGVVIGGIGRSLKRPSGAVQAYLSRLVTVGEETLGGLRVIKGFNAEAYQTEKFSQENNGYRISLTNLLRRRDLASPLSEFLGIATVALLLWYGSRRVFGGEMEAETFLTFIFAFYNVIDPAKQFSRAFYNIQKGVAALDRIEEVIETPRNIVDPESPADAPALSRGIVFDRVGFTYPGSEEAVLQDINLQVPKGKIIALVGASGAGKSTLVDLVARFYDPTQGRILLDGKDLRDYRIADLRELLGVVTQEAILFNDTIYNNITFGRHATLDQVRRAARIAHADTFIEATDQGYDTVVGDRGSKLSGGQRQRITLARAILYDPPLLLLDEATSALDSESELAVQQALESLMQGRTALIIAHRLSTIQHADEIIVMHEGRIVERGTHRELLQSPGTYSRLVKLQNV